MLIYTVYNNKNYHLPILYITFTAFTGVMHVPDILD